MNDIIDRSAGDKFKGARLQKLRAIDLMLTSIQKSPRAHIYGAIEYEEDVYVAESSPEGKKRQFEQNKNYSTDSKFTLNSSAVLNSIVAFLDIWITKEESEKNIYLGFYSTREIGKESKTTFIKRNKLSLPDKPILEILQNKEPITGKVLNTITAIIINEYKQQYSTIGKVGFISVIEKYEEADWNKFFSVITWYFGAEDDRALKETLLKKIKASTYFNYSMEGKEEQILSTLMELVEERQNITEITEKFVYASDIKNVFLEVDAGTIRKPEDPTHQMWEKMTAPTDKRNLKDKIQAVCSDYKSTKMSLLSRSASAGIMEKQNFETEKSFLSLRYRVFHECQKELIKTLEENSTNRSFTEQELDKIIDNLNKTASECMKNLSSDYNYMLNSKNLIEGVILELFDSCFLAFDVVYE